jgi:hypothetical protein
VKAVQSKIILKKKIIFFNGPPRCGKDTAVSKLIQNSTKLGEIGHIKFSDPLKDSLPLFFGLTQEDIFRYEQDKEKPRNKLLGKSWRQVQISLSEDWAKKVYNNDVFGDIALQKIENSNFKYYLVSDSGFLSEASVLIDFFGQENCVLFRIKREGCNFDNDSRSYWGHSYEDLKEITITNNGTIEELVQKCKKGILNE